MEIWEPQAYHFCKDMCARGQAIALEHAFYVKQKISRFEITGFHESAVVFPNLRVFTKCGKIN